jgi:hypothetical protein
VAFAILAGPSTIGCSHGKLLGVFELSHSFAT